MGKERKREENRLQNSTERIKSYLLSAQIVLCHGACRFEKGKVQGDENDVYKSVYEKF